MLHAALQLLDHDLPPDPALPARRHLEQALAETRQLNVLTSQLWEASRIQAGRLRLRCERLSLLPIVRSACARAQALTSRQTIELAAPDADIAIDGDRQRLDQILMNLLLNAIVHAPQTPRIDVRVKRAAADVLIEVQDYGAGVDRSELPRLGRPFYQPHRGDRPSRGGLGLGLYLCRELASLHGGRLDIRSGDDHGARFSLRLPLPQQRLGRVYAPVASSKRRTAQHR